MKQAATSSPTLADSCLARPSAWDGWRPTLIAICLGLSAVIFVHGDTIYEVVSTWNRTGTYKFAWAVLPTFAYLVWHNRRRFAVQTPSGCALGILAATLCALLWTASDLLNISEGRQFALLAGIGAFVLAAVGFPVFRTLAPFLCLLLFLVPTARFLLTPLKHITIGFARAFSAVTGLPFAKKGFFFTVGAQDYVVIDDCAGLSYLLVGLFLGLTLALLVYRKWWKIAALTLLGGGFAILANGLRVVGIVAYDYVTGSELDLAGHGYFELPALALCFSILFIIFSRLRPEPAAEPAAAVPKVARGGMLARAGPAVLAAALIAAGPLVSHGASQGPTKRLVGELLPAKLAGWIKQDIAANWHPKVRSNRSATSLSSYKRGKQQIAVFLAQPASRRGKISGGAIDLAGDAVWLPSAEYQVAACAQESCHTVRHIQLLHRDDDRVRHIYTVYTIGTDTTVSSFDFRVRRAWSEFTGAQSQVRLIAIATDVAGGLEAGDISAIIDALIQQPSSAKI